MSRVPILTAIIGTVGVPARYGGFETLAEQLAVGIAPSRMRFVIYCQRSAYAELTEVKDFAGHRRVMLPLRANGPSSLVHDMLAMVHAVLVARVDTLLVLGYSGAWVLPMVRLIRPGLRVVTNIDGMEWRREKFGPVARLVLRTLEWFATRFSHRLIADNAVLVAMSRELHGIEPTLIAYGGDHTLVPASPFPLDPGYFLSIARVEPENNCHLILAACSIAGSRLVFVGNWHASAYGRSLKQKYSGMSKLTLLDPVYDQTTLAALRAGATGYIHGHSVGGSNPSLIEALFHTNRLFIFDCLFNRATLNDAGAYFNNIEALAALLAGSETGYVESEKLRPLRLQYLWVNIVDEYVQICQKVGF